MWCQGCKAPKAEAVKTVTTNSSVPGAAPESPASKELKKRQARARKREARATAKGNADANAHTSKKKDEAKPETTAQAEAPATGTPETASCRQLCIPEALAKAIPKLLPTAIDDIVASLGKELTPAPLELKTPEEVVAKLLDFKGPVAKAAKKDELDADITRLKAGIAALDSGGDVAAEAVAGLKTKLATAEAAAVKLAKDAPSSGHEHLALREVKSKFELAVQSRKDSEAKGAAKALERKAFRESCITKLKDEIALLEAGVVTLEAENADQYKKRIGALEHLDKQVLDLLDKKIAAVPPPVVTPAPAAASTSPNGSMTELEKIKQENADLLAKLEDARRRGDAMNNKVMAQFSMFFDDVQAEHLPTDCNPDNKYLPTLGALYIAIQTWYTAGAAIPFDWVSFGPVIGDTISAQAITKELLGKTWHKWYKGGNPDDAEVVPRQVALLLHHRLSQIKNVFVTGMDEENILRASRSFECMKDSAKRLRV